MKKPSLRIKRVFKKVVENHGFNVSKAMREEGYTEASAKNPSNVTNTKSWEQLLDEYLPESELVAVHKKALYATKVVTSPTEPDREVDDIPTSLRAAELGYKIRGKLIDRKDVTSGGQIIPLLGGMTNAISNNDSDKETPETEKKD